MEKSVKKFCPKIKKVQKFLQKTSLEKFRKIGYYRAMKMMSKITSWVDFFKSVLREIPHLKLPTKAETLAYLVIVLIMAFITSLMFFTVDTLAYKLVSKFLLFFS